jgi:hypothetical protein
MIHSTDDYLGELEVTMDDATSNPSAPEDFGSELEALGSILKALGPLPDKARDFVLRTAAERLGISFVTSSQKETSSVTVHDSKSGLQGGGLHGASPKEFLKTKRPMSELQRIVCLAYYLTHAQNKRYFKTQDLTALNTDAAGGKFSNPSATVRNATSQSEFFAPAPKGTKQITALGEDYVNALPDQDEAKRVVLSHKPKGMRKRRAMKEQ